MRIAVFGAGGIGGYFGGRLAQAGHDVAFVARGEHLHAMREHGLVVASVAGDFTIDPVEAHEDPARIGEVDAVVVAVKAWQVPEAAAAMAPMVGDDTVVLPLQNGVEAPEQLAEILGTAPVLGGTCGVLAYIDGPGRIRHAGIDPFVRLGELDGRPSERAERLCAAFDECDGVTAEIPDDVRAAMWQKFLFIAAVSGVGAVSHATFGEMRATPPTRILVESAMREAYAVGRARGVALRDDGVELAMKIFDASPADGTSSMQRDIAAGRPSELEAQNGAVVRLGAEADVSTPVNAFLYASLLPSENRARNP